MSGTTRKAVRNALVLTIIMGSLLFAAEARTDNYGGNTRAEQAEMIRLIKKKFPDHIENTMVCIARRESGLNPRAVNWSDQHANGRGSFGLFQLGRIHDHMVGGNYNLFFVPWRNVNAAWRLWRGGGLGPWGGGC